MASNAVPLKIRVSEAPQDSNLDYALYQVVLTLQPRGFGGSRNRSASGVTGPGQGQGDGSTLGGTAGALSSTSGSASVQEVVPLARGDGQVPPPVQWVVLRRYSEFAALRDSLQSDGLLADLDKEDSLWPKKHTLKSSKDKSVVKERLEKLPRWLVSISRLPAVSTHPTFRTFLQLEQFEHELANAAASLRPQVDHAELETSSASPMVPSQPLQSATTTASSPMLRSPPAIATGAITSTSIPALVADAQGMQGKVVSKSLGGGTTVASATSAGMSSRVPSPQDSGHGVTHVQQRQDGLTHTTTTTTTTSATAVDPSLPLHAANEYATARTEVDLRLPKVPLPSDRSPLPHEVVRATEQRLAEVQKEENDAARLRIAADRHRRAASELSADVRARTDDIAVAESEADRLAREAALAEERAKELRAAAQQQSAAVVQLRDKIQQEINSATIERQKSADLVLRARQLEADAASRREAAIAAHEQATRDLLAAERRVREAVEGEEHRQVAEAAAAAARARKLVSEAAKEKAEEEAAIQAAHLAAAQEAEANAALALAQHGLALAAQKKAEAEAKAHAYHSRAHEHTQAAAQASAELDARSKAATIAHSEAVRVASLEARTVAAVEASHENVLHYHPEQAVQGRMLGAVLGADVASVQRFSTSADKDGMLKTSTSSTTVYDAKHGQGVTVTTTRSEQPTHEEAIEAGGQASSGSAGQPEVLSWLQDSPGVTTLDEAVRSQDSEVKALHAALPLPEPTTMAPRPDEPRRVSTLEHVGNHDQEQSLGDDDSFQGAGQPTAEAVPAIVSMHESLANSSPSPLRKRQPPSAACEAASRQAQPTDADTLPVQNTGIQDIDGALASSRGQLFRVSLLLCLLALTLEAAVYSETVFFHPLLGHTMDGAWVVGVLTAVAGALWPWLQSAEGLLWPRKRVTPARSA